MAQPLPDALYSVTRGKQVSVPEAADAMTVSGYASTAAGLNAVVNPALFKDKRFHRAEPGIFNAK